MRVEEFVGIGNEDAVVGEKCTVHYFSDSEPCQVVKVSESGKTCWIRKNIVQADDSKGDCCVGHQNWKIFENEFEKVCVEYKPKYIEYKEPRLAERPDNYSYFKCTKRKDGKWRTVGSDLYVAMGQWHKHYDWSY